MVKYLEFIKAGISQKIAIIFKINIERTIIKDLPKKSKDPEEWFESPLAQGIL